MAIRRRRVDHPGFSTTSTGYGSQMDQDCSALVVFGITGDLARKKIFTALYDLAVIKRLDMPVIGVGRSAWTTEKLRDTANTAVREAHENKGDLDEIVLTSMIARLSYMQSEYDSAELYDALARMLVDHSQVLCYLAVPPTVFADVVEGVANTELRTRVRLLIEKPFGADLSSARQLTALIAKHFDDDQLFAVDHYLQKESLQNVMVLRFANRILEPSWSNAHITKVSITMAEQFGIEGRAGFFDSNGTMRDVVQNHVLQIVAALAMEPPESSSAEHLNNRRAQVLSQVVPLSSADVVFGQYEGYHDVEGVADGSTTDTYVRACLVIDNNRWRGVEWTIIAGKALAETLTEIVVTYGEAVAPGFIAHDCEPEPNQLRIRMSPQETMVLTLQARSAAQAMGTAATEMVTAADYRSIQDLDAYARLFDDARRGDHSQFARADVVQASWQIIDAVLGGDQLPVPYAQQSWGPAVAARSQHWFAPTLSGGTSG